MKKLFAAILIISALSVNAQQTKTMIPGYLSFEKSSVIRGYVMCFDSTSFIFGKYSTVPSLSGNLKDIFIGYHAGNAITTGYSNIFIGYNSGDSVTTGNKLVIIGDNAGTRIKTGNSSLFIGAYSGQNTQTTSGQTNTFAGYGSGTQNTTGYENCYIGSFSGNQNKTGIRNVSVGDYCYYGDSANVGSYNLYSGYKSGWQNRGNLNVMLGAYSGAANVANQYNGDTNLLLGAYSGYGLYGDKNVFIGPYAGYYQTSEDNLFLVGNQNYGSKSNEYANSLLYGDFNTKKLTINDTLSVDAIINPTKLIIGSSARSTIDIQVPNQSLYKGTFFIGTESTHLTQTGGNNVPGWGNSVVGDSAGMSITNGHYNTFFGFKAGKSTTEGMSNTFIGYRSGEKNIGNDTIKYNSGVGYANSFFGSQAGRDNDTGAYNVFLGCDAGTFNTGGKCNVFSGVHAGYLNTLGMYNCYYGFASGYNNTIGSYNIGIGLNALSAASTNSNVIGIGLNAGAANIADGNIFVGSYAGLANTTGASNLYHGYYAGRYNQSGEQNVFFGAYSGYNMNGGGYNVFIGHQTGYGSTGISTRYYNTMIGCQVGTANQGNGNTAIGYQAQKSATNASSCTMIGYKAGYYEMNNNRLYIANSDDRTPILYGEFDNNKLVFTGTTNLFSIKSNMGGTDSCEAITFLSGNPVNTWYATDGDNYNLSINTSDQALFQNAGGGYHFDGNIITTGKIVETQLSGALTDGTPTDAEIDAVTGTTPATVGAGWFVTIKDNNGSGLLYKIESDGTDWFYIVMTKAL